jgi:hypothetical protein
MKITILEKKHHMMPLLFTYFMTLSTHKKLKTVLNLGGKKYLDRFMAKVA